MVRSSKVPRNTDSLPTRTHYRDMFSRDHAGASSSSAPVSLIPEVIPDSQHSQRVSPAPPRFDPSSSDAPPPPPPPPPPPAAGVHPDLEVPPTAPYAVYTVEDIITAPGREGLPELDPIRRDGRNIFWFNVDGCVASSITNCIKYFPDAAPNWKLTTPHTKKTWFKSFAQKWRWSIGINERVRKEFEKKAKQRLLDTVYNWKSDFQVDGYEKGKPECITSVVWDGLIRYWEFPDSVRTSNTNADNRLTRDEHGHTKMLHTGGRKPHAGIRLDMAKETGVLPSLKELYERTHRNKAGNFVDPRSEQFYNEVVARVDNRQTQLTQQTGTPVVLSTPEVDKIYEEVAPKKKGRIIGIGSVNDVPIATSSYAQERHDEATQLRSELQATQSHVTTLYNIMDVLAVGNPQLAEMLRNINRDGIPHQQPQPQPPSQSQPTNTDTEDEELASRNDDFVR